jgi:HSP20 family protein
MSNLSVFQPRLFEPTFGDSFDSLFKRFMAPVRLEMENGGLDIRIDVSEIDGRYRVQADMPGVKKDDINVRIDGNIIQIDAEVNKSKETKDAEGKVLRSERYHGSMSRAFSVAQDVDESKATAKLDDGVLTLDLPKKASTSAKRLSIQ